MISDKESLYVLRVLEIADEISINFRYWCGDLQSSNFSLFSVIAALSERVVDLDAITKGLINKMDIEALTVKMQKCKVGS